MLLAALTAVTFCTLNANCLPGASPNAVLYNEDCPALEVYTDFVNWKKGEFYNELICWKPIPGTKSVRIVDPHFGERKTIPVSTDQARYLEACKIVTCEPTLSIQSGTKVKGERFTR